MANQSKYSGEHKTILHPKAGECLGHIKKFMKPFFDLLWNIYYFYTNKKRGYFILKGDKLAYFNHRHNCTNLNERSVEISIILHLIKKNNDKKILEIGNVLSHYSASYWDIVDKYEKGQNVLNEDVINFRGPQKYGLIVSISTFEHIGHDEEVIDDRKVIDVIKHVKDDLLTADGLFVITVPIGYNKDFDRKLFNEELGFAKTYYFHRISADNKWRECEKEVALQAKYASPYQWANAIAICSTKRLNE